MSKVLIIGYGNTLRGDDAAGVKAAELISMRHPEITCVVMHQLVPELSEQITECDTVFFIDAQQGITQPTVRLMKPGMEADQPHTHFISPESLLSLSQQLYQRTPSKAYIIGIPATEFEFSETLSAQTENAVHECVTVVEKYLTL